MRELTGAEAIREALREELDRDASVYLIGEDIGVYGGSFGVTLGLIEEFGPERVRETPISEAAIVGTSVGAAILGMRPVAEIMFSDFVALTMDQLVNQAAKMRYMSGGQLQVPMVVRTPCGAGTGAAAQHSQSLEAWYAHVPGLLVAMPSTPYDAKGLLKTAIRNDNPVVFLEHKLLYKLKGPVPEGEYTVPFGKADIKRAGTDVTIVATSMMVHNALGAATDLEKHGVSAEVIDPRTLVPFDRETILESVGKTGRLVIVHEAPERGGFGGEIAAVVAGSDAFHRLKAPIKRICGSDTPIPFSKTLEQHAVPTRESIVRGVLEVARVRAPAH
ncbi:MAG: alpha-ketoacid dehydrogenase subunit beta [Ignavibacteriales bacterium]